MNLRLSEPPRIRQWVAAPSSSKPLLKGAYIGTSLRTPGRPLTSQLQPFTTAWLCSLLQIAKLLELRKNVRVMLCQEADHPDVAK